MNPSPRHASPRGRDTGPDAGGPPRRAPSSPRLGGRIALYLAASLVLALAIAVGLELVHTVNDPWKEPLERFAALQADVVLLGALVVWALLVFLLALTGRLWISAGVTLTLATMVGFADYQKMRLRSEPLYPSDVTYLGQFRFLVESVGTGRALGVAAALVAIPAVAWGVARLVGRRMRPGMWVPTRLGRRVILARGATGVVSAAVLLSAVTFNQPGNVTREAYEAAGVYWAPWSQLDNYAKNGFLAGLLYNLPATAMDRPADYDAATMEAVVARWREAAVVTNATRDAAALADTNIVLVLGESFSDPLRMAAASSAGVTVAEDPLPFTRSLMDGGTSGTMLSSGYGGGTANVEFEVLTGMAVSNFQSQLHSPFQMLVSQQESFPSFVRTFGEPDRATLTLHPYLASFYRREVVYPVLGFERSEFIQDMTHTDRLEGDRYVSDAATYTELVDELRASERPMFVNVVTMQNHPPQKGYLSPIGVEGPFDATENAAMGQYLRGLKYSDEALAQLVADLAALDERTIVLFYGDHLPTVWPQEVLDTTDPALQYETPWFVFANFETAEVDPGVTIGPNLLVNQLLAAAQAPVTPYNALLAALAEEDPTRAPELLADYRLVQYDLSVGEGYSTEAMLSVPAQR